MAAVHVASILSHLYSALWLSVAAFFRRPHGLLYAEAVRAMLDPAPRPSARLLSSVAATALAAGAVLVAASIALRNALFLSDAYPWRTAALFAAIVAMALGWVSRKHPFRRFGPANQATTVRALLVALVSGFLWESGREDIAAAAGLLTLLVSLLDGVDGWLARKTKMASDFGARFDMETDALLVMVLSLLAWQLGKAGPWVLASGLLRYGFVAASWWEPALARPLFPSRRRQTICVVQIAGLNLVIVPFVRFPVSSSVAAVALGCLVYSFAVDIAWLWQRREVPERPPTVASSAQLPAVD